MFFGGVHSLLDGRGSSANPTRVAQRGPEFPGASWAIFFLFVCPQHQTTFSGPSWAAAVCRLLLPCSV